MHDHPALPPREPAHDEIGAILADLAPPPLVVAHAVRFVLDGPMDNAERAALAGAVQKRRRDFATGRRCAVDALAASGCRVSRLGREEGGAPVWPEGFVGSISHTQGLCVAVVARRADVALLGIDVEARAPLAEGVLDLVASPEEKAALALLPDGAPFDTALFSAKESAYKAIWPRVRRFVDFREAEVAFAPEASGTRGTFAVTLDPPLAQACRVNVLPGRYAFAPDHVATIVAVPSNA